MRSILDTDLYELTMGQAVLKKFPYAQAEYSFFNRRLKQQITREMADRIHKKILACQDLALTDYEANFLLVRCPYLQPWYVDWLRQFRLNAKHVTIYNSPTFSIDIKGPWCETIYWEVPILAIITEEIMLTQGVEVNLETQSIIARNKMAMLSDHACLFAEFGTRRRYSYEVQDAVLSNLRCASLLGTSNVHLAHKYDLKPIGTMAHEWIQAISGLVGLRHANKFALEAWNDVYGGDLGIALSDTFTSEAFFKDFDGSMSRMFDGVRHDSGNPMEFARRVIAHYTKLRINPFTKQIVFSDSLNVRKCIELADALRGKIQVSFGIGTHLTNDVPSTIPANIVIKLIAIDGIPVIKLSDDPGKAIGDPKAINVAKWTFGIA